MENSEFNWNDFTSEGSNNQPFDWNNYSDIPSDTPRNEAKESDSQWLLRNASRMGIKGANVIASLPADVASGLKNLVVGAVERFPNDSNELLKLGKQIKGAPPGHTKINLPKVREAPQMLHNILGTEKSNKPKLLGGLTEGPTSSELSEFEENASGGYLAPKTRGEQIADDVTTNFISLFLPGLKGSSAGRAATKAGVATGLGSVAKEGAKELGFSENEANSVGFATRFLTGIATQNGRVGVDKHAQNLYNQARKSIPKGTTFDFSMEEKYLKGIRDKLVKGGLAPSEQFTVSEIDKVLAKIKNGKIDPETAWGLKRSLNENLLKYEFDNPYSPQRARSLAFKVQRSLHRSLRRYGKVNPQFGTPFQQAEEAFSAISSSRKASRFLQRHLKTNVGMASSGGGGSALIYALSNNPALIPGAAAGAATTYGALKSGELLIRVAKSPVLRRYYTKILTSAAEQNSLGLKKHITEFNKAAEKDSEVQKLVHEIESEKSSSKSKNQKS